MVKNWRFVQPRRLFGPLLSQHLSIFDVTARSTPRCTPTVDLVSERADRSLYRCSHLAAPAPQTHHLEGHVFIRWRRVTLSRETFFSATRRGWKNQDVNMLAMSPRSFVAVLAVCVVTLAPTMSEMISVPQGSAAATYGSSSSASMKPIKSIRQLHNAYGEIFLTRNRNAASHLWISHVLQRAPSMTRAEVEHVLTGFCAVSGSPVSPHDYNRRVRSGDSPSTMCFDTFLLPPLPLGKERKKKKTF